MSDLVSRVLAAIETREKRAKDCMSEGEGWRDWQQLRVKAPWMTTADAVLIALHDPAAVLRRCAADRKMVGIHARLGDLKDPEDLAYPEAADTCFTCGPGDHYSAQENPEWYPFPCSTLRTVASGYGISAEEKT